MSDELQIAKWSPLKEVVKVVGLDRFLSKSLYKVEEGFYLYVTPFSGKDLEKGIDGPFVTAILWAVSDGAAKRAACMDIESDDNAVRDVPDGFLPNGANATYGCIINVLKLINSKICQEKAAYRIATDGAFVHRVIETEAFVFFFRGGRNNDDERPYAVMKKL